MIAIIAFILAWAITAYEKDRTHRLYTYFKALIVNRLFSNATSIT